VANPKRGRLIAAIIVLIGAVLLIAALFMPWYYQQLSGSGATETQNTYPGYPSTNGTIQYSCSGFPSGFSCPPQTSYTDSRLNNTGMIAETGFFLLIVGFVFGIIAAIFGLMSRGNARRASPAIWLGVIALILAIATPVLFAAALPSAIAKDIPTSGRYASSGPWSSFIGSTSISVPISGTASWGPGIGWYLSIVAFVLLLVGVILLARYRREPPKAAAVAPASPPVSSGSPPASTPPKP
jgi:hypothetical protein